MPFGKLETSRVPMSVPGHRLRREALRILAHKLEGSTLSSTGADNLLAKYGTLADSLRAVRSHSARRRQSGRFGGVGVFGTEVGPLLPSWIVRGAAVLELCLAALFLKSITSGIDVSVWLHSPVDTIGVLYLVASSFALLALVLWWRATRR